jgi:hypothetical protein|tara:strand:- start:336 stop:698 length:363 start_codon:yes stop_codon:yes gene_type:complete
MAIQLKLIIITLSLVLLSPIGSKADEMYPTKDVREMWQMCSHKFARLKVMPYIYRDLCDCYVDLMRKTFTKKEFLAITPSQTRATGEMLKTACPIKQEQTEPIQLTNGDRWKKNSQNRHI